MKFFLFFLLVFLFTSCFSTYIYFDQQQPRNGIELSSAPDELLGKWKDSTGLKINISTTCLLMTVPKKDNIGTVVGIDTSYSCLSDSIKLQKAGDYYVLNLLHKDEKWQVFIIRKDQNGDQVWYYPQTAPYFGKGHGLKVERIDATYKLKEKGDSIFVEQKPLFKKSFRPNKKVESIDAVHYNGQFRIKDIEKVIKPENVFWILKANGTIVVND